MMHGKVQPCRLEQLNTDGAYNANGYVMQAVLRHTPPCFTEGTAIVLTDDLQYDLSGMTTARVDIGRYTAKCGTVFSGERLAVYLPETGIDAALLQLSDAGCTGSALVIGLHTDNRNRKHRRLYMAHF